MGRRTLAVLIGLVVLSGYLAAAYLVYRALAVLVAGRPDSAVLIVAFLLATLLSGYVSYRFGTVGLLRSLDARALPRSHAPGLHRRTDALVERMDLERPDLLVASLGVPNAIALALTGIGKGMAWMTGRRDKRALRKIERASQPRIGPFRIPVEREEHPLERVLSTHPSTDERVERLAERARGRRVPIE